MREPAELLHFQGVDKTVGRLKALSGFDLTVTHGEFVALVGRQGSGKTAVLRIAAGLDRPDRGSVTLVGEPYRPSALSSVGAALPDVAMDPKRSILANLFHVADLHGLRRSSANARIAEVLDRFELADREHDRVTALGEGDRRRAEIARAVLHAPALVLLGNVTEGLSPTEAQRLMEDAERLRDDEGTAVLWATVRPEEADRADRIVVLRRGSAIFDGTPAKLKSQQGKNNLDAAVRALTGEHAATTR